MISHRAAHLRAQTLQQAIRSSSSSQTSGFRFLSRTASQAAASPLAVVNSHLPARVSSTFPPLSAAIRPSILQTHAWALESGVSKPKRRAFSQTTSLSKDHHFDTLKVVEKLKEEGFTEEQAMSLMRVLNDVIEERYALSVVYFY
jgi:alkylhydroperoxidase family enzyme